MNSNFDYSKIKIIKKDGTIETFNPAKIISATQKSATRVYHVWNEEEKQQLIEIIKEKMINSGDTEFCIETIHSMVEYALEIINPVVAKQYRNYRNWKDKYNQIYRKLDESENRIRYIGDRSNANKDAKLVATKRSLIYGEYSKYRYEQFFLTDEERQIIHDGYFYIHDEDSRLDSWNCVLFDVKEVFTGGFEMGNQWYSEPNSLDTAFDVLGDVIIATAAQQYGGFTVPEIDKFLLPYAEKTYKKYYDEYMDIAWSFIDELSDGYRCDQNAEEAKKKAKKYAFDKTKRECEQGYQGIEYKLNTVGSSRGDYPFTTFTFGLATEPLGQMIVETILAVHKRGQGKKGKKKPVLFPKLVFLYDEELHGEKAQYENMFLTAIDCSSRTMYPDYLSLTGEGYVPSMYKKHNKAISPMGCRAFLSPWYERGGMYPEDEKDIPVFVGRCNLGVVTLHLPMIYMKARNERKDFYETLSYYLEVIRNFHKRTIEYLGNLRAGCNPVMFCEGGLYGGHLKPDEKIAPVLKPMTISFGVTALNELQYIHNGKSIREDGQFALDVMAYINEKANQFKKEDDILYAIYGTPAETLCGKQIEQFRAKYGVVENVSSRDYTTNSFHDAVWEDITPVEKQDDELRFWNYFNGGKIQYCRYPVTYNTDAIKTLVRRAMKLGFYEGVNLSLSYCNTCGHQETEMEFCPNCGSHNITSINRMNGYLGFTRSGTVDGNPDFDSSPEKTGRFNKAKTIEISERVSM